MTSFRRRTSRFPIAARSEKGVFPQLIYFDDDNRHYLEVHPDVASINFLQKHLPGSEEHRNKFFYLLRNLAFEGTIEIPLGATRALPIGVNKDTLSGEVQVFTQMTR